MLLFAGSLNEQHSGFLSGIFAGGKIYCYANFFVMLIFLLFLTKFQGEVSEGGTNCLRGGPCERKPDTRLREYLSTGCKLKLNLNLCGRIQDVVNVLQQHLDKKDVLSTDEDQELNFCKTDTLNVWST